MSRVRPAPPQTCSESLAERLVGPARQAERRADDEPQDREERGERGAPQGDDDELGGDDGGPRGGQGEEVAHGAVRELPAEHPGDHEGEEDEASHGRPLGEEGEVGGPVRAAADDLRLLADDAHAPRAVRVGEDVHEEAADQRGDGERQRREERRDGAPHLEEFHAERRGEAAGCGGSGHDASSRAVRRRKCSSRSSCSTARRVGGWPPATRAAATSSGRCTARGCVSTTRPSCACGS